MYIGEWLLFDSMVMLIMILFGLDASPSNITAQLLMTAVRAMRDSIDVKNNKC